MVLQQIQSLCQKNLPNQLATYHGFTNTDSFTDSILMAPTMSNEPLSNTEESVIG